MRGEAVSEHRLRTLRAWPERRVVHGVRLERGWWVCNLHAQAHSEARAQADVDAGRPHGDRVVGGQRPSCSAATSTCALRSSPASRARPASGVDHVFARSLRAARPGRTLDRGPLSDHLPLVVEVG